MTGAVWIALTAAMIFAIDFRCYLLVGKLKNSFFVDYGIENWAFEYRRIHMMHVMTANTRRPI